MPDSLFVFFFFFNDTATTEIYTLSLHDALPICGREAEVLGDAPAQIARDFGRAAIVVARRGGSAVHLGGELGREVEHEAAPQVAEADQATRLNEKARVGADRGGPGLLVPRVLHGAQDLDGPILGVGALIAETLEGNPHLPLVAPLAHAAPRLA